MNKLIKYRQILQDFALEHREVQLIFDIEE